MATTHVPTRHAPVRYRACLEGRAPAEDLAPRDRELLVTELWESGWTDVEIAEHTRMTTYTTGRIRGRLGLEPHPNRRGAAA